MPRRHVAPLRGMIEPSAALQRLLRGSGLRAVATASGVWRLDPLPRDRAGTVTRNSFEDHRDIVVTATKRGEYLSSIPISISVIRPDAAQRLIDERGVHDLVGDGEGAFATNLGPGRDRIFLRGVADSAFNGPTQSTVSLFLDDARVSYATPDPDLRLVDVDHVELLRGPQGTLYGTGALGGIIRIVPNKADPTEWTGFAAVEGSAVQHGGTGGAVEAGLNAPLVADRLAVRVVGYADQTGGWIDDDGRNRRNVNRSRRYGGRLTARWHFAEDWTLDAGLTTQWINADDSQYAVAGRRKATAVAEPHDNDFLAATMTLRGMIGALDILSTSAYVTHEVESIFDAGNVAAMRGLSAPLAFSDLRRLKLGTQEFRISDPSAGRPWVAGISLLTAENSYRGTFLPSSGAAIPALALHDDALEAALFGEASLPLGSGFTFTAGLRAFLSNVDNEQAGQTRRRARKAGLTPSATLSWAPNEERIVWLHYASAIRPGGINPDGDPRLADFRSDDLKNIEIGWRLRVARRLHLSGALFALRWENVQSDSLGTDGLVRTINAGKARNFGAELSTSLDLRPWSIETNLTVQHARLYEPSAATNAIGDDNRLPVLPDYAGRLKLGYAWRLGEADAGLFVAARYVGRARISFDPELARSMGGYWTADAGLTLSDAPWRVALTISNLLDGKGDSFGFGNPFSFRSERQRTPIRPRTLAFRLERKF